MDDMPNAGEIIERLARENERQKIEIEQLKHKVDLGQALLHYSVRLRHMAGEPLYRV